jgi:cell wall-associated NlpC family hydrolase
MQVRVTAAGLWTSPLAPRPLDTPALDCPTDLVAWADAQGPDERRDLWGRLDTQALYGETVVVEAVDPEGWARVVLPGQPSSKDPRGYPGYVPLSQLGTPAEETGKWLVVTRPVARLREEPGGGLVSELSFATVLPAGERTGQGWRVNLPGGGMGWLSDAEAAPHVPRAALPTAADLLGAGRQFLGLMYLAGGLSAYGLDCSGLVHGVYRRFGHVVPRDAADMVAIGEPVDIADLTPGDLMFFRKPDTGFVYHVGICAGVGGGRPAMLQSSQTDWDTIDGPITDVRHEHLWAARRWRAW